MAACANPLMDLQVDAGSGQKGVGRAVVAGGSQAICRGLTPGPSRAAGAARAVG